MYTYRVTCTDTKTAIIVAESKEEAIQKGQLKQGQETAWTSQKSSMSAEVINEQQGSGEIEG
jgi:hypothetical protein